MYVMCMNIISVCVLCCALGQKNKTKQILTLLTLIEQKFILMLTALLIRETGGKYACLHRQARSKLWQQFQQGSPKGSLIADRWDIILHTHQGRLMSTDELQSPQTETVLALFSAQHSSILTTTLQACRSVQKVLELINLGIFTALAALHVSPVTVEGVWTIASSN